MEIRLTEQQEELLRWIVLQAATLKQREFIFANRMGGEETIAIAPDAREARRIRFADLEQMKFKGLISFVERGPPASQSNPVYERIAPTAEAVEFIDAPPLGIDLEPELQELLATMVEHLRNTPRTERGKFLVLKTLGSTSLFNLSSHQLNREVYEGDVEALANAGLLTVSYNRQGEELYDVSQQGYRYYEELQRRKGAPVERISSNLRNYLNAQGFLDEHRTSYSKWVEAEEILWGGDSSQRLTTIGHLCREAMQAFASEIVGKYKPEQVDPDITHVVGRIRAVLDDRKSALGDTECAFLDALLIYWGTVSDLAQRQEHDSKREGETLLWEDARRLVFQSVVVMYEIHRALTR
jgi:hypothetical protein